MSIAKLTKRMSALASSTRDARTELEDSEEAVRDSGAAIIAILTDVGEKASKLRGLRARATGTASTPAPLIPEVLGDGDSSGSFGEKKTAIFDEEDKLDEYVSRQQDSVRAILENPILGQLLEGYARVFQYLETNKFTSAEQLRDAMELRKSLKFVEQRIKELGGVAGREFSFIQFRKDLEAALRDQVKSSVRSVIPSNTSGTLGSPPQKSCGSSTSLAVLQASGALR